MDTFGPFMTYLLTLKDAIKIIDYAINLCKGIIEKRRDGRVFDDLTFVLGVLREEILRERKMHEQTKLTLTATEEKVVALKAELAQLEQSYRDFERYELKAVAPGYVVYALRKIPGCTEPPHWICPQCRAKGEKSVMHPGGHLENSHAMRCPSCGYSVMVEPKIINDFFEACEIPPENVARNDPDLDIGPFGV
jgi:DNA-directed RNA polymerase subunit RPC12/RpoP